MAIFRRVVAVPLNASQPLPWSACAAGIAAAAGAAALTFFLIVVIDQGISVFGAGELISLVVVSVALAALIGVPLVAILRSRGALRWMTLSAWWAIAAAVLIGAILTMIPDDDWLLGDITSIEILAASAIAGVFGWISGTACWFTIAKVSAIEA